MTMLVVGAASRSRPELKATALWESTPAARPGCSATARWLRVAASTRRQFFYDRCVNVAREALYKEVWAEPMTTVAKRYDVSSNYLARICERLDIPRPPRGYWQQRAAGMAVDVVPLPEPQPGDDVEWARDGARPAIAPMSARSPRPRRAVAERPEKHQLLIGARGDFEEVRAGREVLYVIPRKRNLVDIFVTPATLDRALKGASELFLLLEERGHRVVLAPAARGYERAELNVREGEKDEYDYGSYERGRWHPAVPTVALVGDLAIGLTLYETMEEVDSVWRDGKRVRVEAPPAANTKRASFRLPLPYVSKSWFPTGRLGIHAYSAQHVTWEQTWIEKAAGDFPTMCATVAKGLEAAIPALTKLLEERALAAEKSRREYAVQQERWRRESEERQRKEEEAARVKRIEEDVASWRLARDIRAFIAETKQTIDDGKCTITKGGTLESWLEWALAYAEQVDPLGRLREDIRRVVAERDARAAGADRGGGDAGHGPAAEADGHSGGSAPE